MKMGNEGQHANRRGKAGRRNGNGQIRTEITKHNGKRETTIEDRFTNTQIVCGRNIFDIE